ncbi:oxysterol-binding protein-related protein 4B-like [Andrographis paniculata]|uniref:oxysterol-binding protein-related protein 4B-like n=1 Tax=Andrographis paniculata TaxID=175694 RepID=UPI0021E89B6A|nr:oxysterol-binding protein-related protein 4B-like [Andrographis paniculata]
MVTEGNLNLNTQPVLTAPLSLESDDSSSDSNYRAPNVVKRVLSLLNNARTGSDLTRLQLPPLFNIPKSQLQCYGESVYSVNTDVLSKCSHEETPLARFISVVAWSISTVRPLAFGLAPYNPVLGETHHVSRGTLNVLLEQVSHHPPVTALQATDKKHNIEMLWCHSPLPKFYGTHIETEVHGSRQLKLLDQNETYTMNSPKLVIRLFPIPRVEWMGNVRVHCQETGLEADLSYRGNSFFPRPSMHRSIKGTIFLSSTSEALCEINGHWDRTVAVKSVATGETSIIYNAKEALAGLKAPVVDDPKAISSNESTVVWGKVSEAILQKAWDKAREAKSRVEEWQRQMAVERSSSRQEWAPKHFMVSRSAETGWDCSPKNNAVPPAPIRAPDR